MPPGEGFGKEDEELKVALKTHKPQFHANLAVVRTFEEILAHKSANIGTQARGIEAKVKGVFASAFMKVVGDFPGMTPSTNAMVELIRSSTMRNDFFYDDDLIT